MCRLFLVALTVSVLGIGPASAGNPELVVESAQIKKTKANGKAWDAPNGPPDPYVIVFVQPAGEKKRKQIGKTTVQKDTYNPRWSANMPAVKVGDVVTVEVWDKDAVQDDFIGRHTFTVTGDHIKQGTLHLSFDQVEKLQLILRPADDAVAKKPDSPELPSDSRAALDKRPRLVAQLGHSDWVHSVAFSRDGKQVLTGSSDKTARLWDAQSGKQLQKFTGHSAGILSVAFSPDGTQVLTGGNDQTARLWDARSGKELHAFTGHADRVCSVAFSRDGKQVLTGSFDKKARLWDAQTGKEVHAFTHHANWIYSVAFSPDGKQVLIAGVGKTRSWDAKSGKVIHAFTGHAKEVMKEVMSVAFSTDGKQVLTGNADNTAQLWDARSGKELRAFRGHTGHVCSVAFSRDGKQVLTGSFDKTARLWDAQSGKELRVISGHSEVVLSVAFSPDGKQVLTGGREEIARLWDAQSGKELLAFTGYAERVLSATFSLDGKQLLTAGSFGKTPRLWDAQTGKERRAFIGHAGGVWSVSFSRDSKLVLTGGRDQTARLWDAQSGKQLHVFTGHAGGVWSVAFSPDGKQALTGSFDKTARLWDTQSGKELHVFKGHGDKVCSVAFSPDGKQVLTGSFDKTARLWDAQSGKEVHVFKGHGDKEVFSVAFSPDGKQVLTGSSDKTARLWDAQSGKELRAFTGHSGDVLSVAFSSDGKQVLTGSLDQTARLWDTQSGKQLRAFTGHAGWVFSVSFAHAGKHVLTGSADGTTRIWEAQTSRELCKLISFTDGAWAVVDSDGRFDASNGGDVEGLHWVVGNEFIALKQLKQRYYDPGLLAKYVGFNKQPFQNVETFREVKLHPEVTVAELKPSDKKLTLKLTDRGGGIGRVQVFVNGKEFRADARGRKPDIDGKQPTLIVDLAGAPVIPGKPNEITVVTWNAEGYLSSRGLVRKWAPEGEADSNPLELHVIVCGVSDYADPKLKLRFAAKDAEDMAHALELAGKRFFGADKVHLTLLSTGNHPKAHKPTKENIRKAFESARKAKPTDVLVVYLAGHGVALKQGSDEYCYLTADAQGNDTADPDVLALRRVTSSELVDWINKIPALKQVMLLDTCAAGAAKGKFMEHRDLPGDQVRAMERLKDRTGFHVLMGCAADRVSYEASEYSQGLLTYSLLQGMAGARLREGEYVDVSRLFQYAADEVPNLARGIGGVQKPLVFSPGGSSFDIGRMIESDRKSLVLAQPKPVILRPLLTNVEDGDDNLELASLVGKHLADLSQAGPRGVGKASAVYINADKYQGAVRPVGNYTVEGKTVRVRLALKKDKEKVADLMVQGSTDDLPALAVKLAEAIEQAVKKP